MKIQKFTSMGWDPDEVATVVAPRVGIQFQSMHNGSYKALVPVKLPNAGGSDTRVITTSIPVVIASETSRNNKGRTRMMVKVNLPYNAMSAAAGALTEASDLFDPARSGGEIQCHLVLSLPKTAADDIRGTHGSLNQRSASAQVFLAAKLLATLLEGYTGGQTAFVPDGRGKTTEVKLVQPAESAELVGEYLVGTTSAKEPAVTFDITPIAGFAGNGIDVSGLSGGGAFLNNPVVRGLNGLEPISEDEDYTVPAVALVSTTD